MTKLEKKALAKLIDNARTPSVPASQYGGDLGRVELHSTAEAGRLLGSEDFKKGWELCHAKFTEALQMIAAGNAEHLKLYARQ